MAALRTLIVKLVKDEAGTETIEYAVIAGLIVVATISAVALVGTKVAARWTTIKSSNL
jgi:Flp pilus assembly pilin Flp